MCPHFATSFTAEGVVTFLDVMVMMTTDAGGPVWVDREAQLASDAGMVHTWVGQNFMPLT